MGKRRLEDNETEDGEKWERRVRDICVVAVKTIHYSNDLCFLPLKPMGFAYPR